jgi:hypothetical protein
MRKFEISQIVFSGNLRFTLLFNTKKYIAGFRFVPSVCYYDLFLVSFVCVFDQLRHSTFSESINLACCRASISYFLRKAMEIKTQTGELFELEGTAGTRRFTDFTTRCQLFTNSSNIIHKFFESCSTRKSGFN